MLSMFLSSSQKDISKPVGTPASPAVAGLNPSDGQRPKRSICYVDLDDSDDAIVVSSGASEASFLPDARKTGDRSTTAAHDPALETSVHAEILPERGSLAGHSLRPRSTLQQSEKASNMIQKRRRVSQRKTPKKTGPETVSSDVGSLRSSRPAPLLTSRQAIRHVIATETAVKRANFFRAKKDYFLPLLPEVNYVQKLVNKREDGLAEGKDGGETQEDLAESVLDEQEISPYVHITEQPRGYVMIAEPTVKTSELTICYSSVRATMKPYQLTGLSFLLYLHKNGLSGILGDEMGLGKTLQTLALFQYLKEHGPSTAAVKETRPFLVVCPLSVLSSWMAESHRWTPDLKVMRFHGPASERVRLKRIAEGLEDHHGRIYARPGNRQKARHTRLGKPLISLDTDSEQETQTAAGFDLVVTTYETFQSEQNWFKRVFVWQYVVLDEGHKIKNDLSLVATALQGLHAEFRLILTGSVMGLMIFSNKNH